MRRRLKLSSRILASVVGILTACTLVGFALVTLRERSTLQRQYQLRALAIAQTFAAIPSIREAMVARTPADRRLIQALAQRVRRETGASYIVVIDRHGARYSHPDPALIGKRVSEPLVALDGRNHLGIDHGNLGVSANAKTPLYAPGGHSIIGEVSAGILERRISDQLLRELPALLLYFACALGIGVLASVTLARRLKRSTFGLELEEIAALVQEREAMLHGIREGVITLDRDGRVTLINDEARRLTGLGSVTPGERLERLLAPGRLRELLSGAEPGADRVLVSDEHILVVNRMPVSHRGRELGAVVTLRDRTELEGLVRELDSVDALSEALRAQQHEFSNRMHTVAGLIELGDHDAAVRYALEVSGASAALAETIRERIEPTEIAAMLLAKTTIAAERGVELRLRESSRLSEAGVDVGNVLTIAGNLIDNAIDAAAAGDPPAHVSVLLKGGEGLPVVIDVSDSGRGVAPENRAAIFADGFTTKPPDGRRQHGIGLALVHRLVHRMGGLVSVDSRPTRFTVTLPARAPADAEVARVSGIAAAEPRTVHDRADRACERAPDRHADRRRRLPRGHDPHRLRAPREGLHGSRPRLDPGRGAQRDRPPGAVAGAARPLPARRQRAGAGA